MKQKVAWAFDPYAKNKESWKTTLKALDKFGVLNSSEVTPTFLMGHKLIHWVANITPSQIEALEPIVRKVLESAFSELNTQVLNTPEVVVSKGYGLREDVQVFANYLQSNDCKMVILNTHAREGLSRLFMGSFTETFLTKAKVPALVLAPDAQVEGEYKSALYPTSFSKNEFAFLKSFLQGPLAPVELVLYSKVFHPIDAFAQTASYTLGGGWVSLEAFTQDVITERKKLSEEWVEFAQSKNVKVKVVIDDQPGELSECVQKVAGENKVDLILMPSFAGPTEAMMMGSNAREVIRHANIPVYVQHIEA